MSCCVRQLFYAHHWLGRHFHLVFYRWEKHWHPTTGRSGTICELRPDGRRNIRNMSFVEPSL
jgi:hypothetical protein